MKRPISNYISGKGGSRSLTLSKQLAKTDQQSVKNQITQNETAKNFQQSANDPSKQPTSSVDSLYSKGPLHDFSSLTSYSKGRIANLSSTDTAYSKGANLNSSSPSSFLYHQSRLSSQIGPNVTQSLSLVKDSKDTKITDILERSSKRLEDLVKISNSLLTEEQKKKSQIVVGTNNLGERVIASPGGGFGGGGGAGGGGGGINGFLKNLGRKTRLGLRGGVYGAIADTAGSAIMSGLEAYQNYNLQMATAPVETYSNIAELKGFQQRRFLRDLSDFSPEAMVLRNKSLRFDQTDITNRIDKIATETTAKKDKAEFQAAIKDSITGLVKSTFGGAVTGAGSEAGGLGALSGFIKNFGQQFAGIFNNPAMMRNQTMFGDLYLKNRTAFDTQNIIQNTQAMENAVLQNSQIDIAVQREYQKTLGPRIGGAQQGRYFDVFGGMNQLGATLGFNTPDSNFFTPVGRGDQSEQIKRMAAYLYTPGKKPENFAQVLTSMGRQVGTQEAESVMQMLSNVGGAGAGPLQARDFQSLEKVRQMSASGRGSAEALLGQAGILGRLSGGISVEQNMKKLEEVLGRAVATGMDNSELGSAFVQNVANMSAKMQSGDVGAIAALVQKMQTAGGGQLIDYQRVQKSMSGFDLQRQQNLGVKTMARENVATLLKEYSETGLITGEDALSALTTFSEMTTEEVETLTPTMQKYLGAKSEKEKAAAFSGLSASGKNLALKFKNQPDKLRLLTDKKFQRGLKNAFGAAAAVRSVAGYKEDFKVEPVDFRKADAQTQQEIARELDKYQGGSAVQGTDVQKVMGAKAGNIGAAIDQKLVNEQEKRMDQINKEAGARGALGFGGKGEITFGSKLQSLLKSVKPGTPEYQAAIQSENFKNILAEAKITQQEALMVPGILETIGSKNDLLARQGVDQNILKKLDTTTSQAQGAQDVTSVSDRPQGSVMSTQDAALLGESFADAFFKRMSGQGSQAPSTAATIAPASTDKSIPGIPGEMMNLFLGKPPQ